MREMNPPHVGIEAGPEDVSEQIDGDEEANEKCQDACGHRCAIKLSSLDLRKGKGRARRSARAEIFYRRERRVFFRPWLPLFLSVEFLSFYGIAARGAKRPTISGDFLRSSISL